MMRGVGVSACSYLVCKAWKDKGERRECAEERLFLKRTMRDYRRAGMHLDAATRAEVEALRRKVKELENTYQQNLSEDNTTLCVACAAVVQRCDVVPSSASRPPLPSPSPAVIVMGGWH